MLTGLPLATEMFFQMRSIGSRTFETFPVLVGATLYYLIITSVLMVGQVWLERRFGRGVDPHRPTGLRRPRTTATVPSVGEGEGR